MKNPPYFSIGFCFSLIQIHAIIQDFSCLSNCFLNIFRLFFQHPLIDSLRLYPVTEATINHRKQVANTLSYRRHKGTALVLEELAHAVTGWHIHVVEFFKLMATTQYMNHVRPDNLQSPNLRQWEPLELLGTPFNTIAHTLDVRSIAHRRGKFNISNVGLYLWRLRPYSMTDVPACRLDERLYLVNPLGANMELYTCLARSDAEDDVRQPNERINLPMPISRRQMGEYLHSYYGLNKSFLLTVDGTEIDEEEIVICDLSEAQEDRWTHLPHSKYAIDPVLGRVVIPADRDIPISLCTSFYYGFSADIGGGEYARLSTFTPVLKPIEQVASTFVTRSPLPNPSSIRHVSIQEAINRLNEFGDGGVVEIIDSGRYHEIPVLSVPTGRQIEIRAADYRRPTLVLEGSSYNCGHIGIGAELL